MSRDRNTINPLTEEESYRDFVNTITEDGKRNWIYPKKPSGRFYRYRTVLSWFLLGFLFAGPFITINGNPLILMNILERKFVLFGLVFLAAGFLPLLPGHADHRHLCGVVHRHLGGGCSVDGYVRRRSSWKCSSAR